MNEEKVLDNLSILIIGYDGYKDIWDHDIYLLNKYWNDRPQTYLADSVLTPKYKGVKIINAGEGSEWSKKVQVALDTIETKYVLLLLEDFFITDYVKNRDLVKILNLMERDGILFYQLLVQLINPKWEKGKSYKGNKSIKIIPAQKKYGINLQAAIWNKDYLKETVGKGNYNAWEFEVNQLKRTNYNDERIEYLIDVRNILNITHAIVQSKYLRSAKRKLKKLGIFVSEEERIQMSVMDDFKYNLKLMMYSLTPKYLVKPAKSIGRMLKIDFVTDRVGK